MADIPPGMLSRVYPNDPESLSMLYGRLDAQRAHAELEQLHNIADMFRELAIIPATSRDNSSWQWATPLGERGRASDDLASFVYLQREGHRAGIYTETEAAAAEADNPSREVSASEREIARAKAGGIY